MGLPTGHWCAIAPLLCCFGFAVPAGALDLPPGQTTVTFEWKTAEGPVELYWVEVDRWVGDRNGENFQFETFTPHPNDPTQKTVKAHIDGKLVTAPAWPAHPEWLAKFLDVLGTRIEL